MFFSAKRRLPWFILALSALAFELIALFFQYGLEMEPCVLCIYQRCAIWGIFAAGLLGTIKPGWLILRILAFMLWLYSAYQGLKFAFEHVAVQFTPSVYTICPLRPNFPEYLPLDSWLPGLFQASGVCGERVWQFLSLEMSQWMVVIFASYLVIAALVLLLQIYQWCRKK